MEVDTSNQSCAFEIIMTFVIRLGFLDQVHLMGKWLKTNPNWFSMLKL